MNEKESRDRLKRMYRRSQRVLPGRKVPPGSVARTALEHAQMLAIGYGVRNGDGRLVINAELVEPEKVGELV